MSSDTKQTEPVRQGTSEKPERPDPRRRKPSATAGLHLLGYAPGSHVDRRALALLALGLALTFGLLFDNFLTVRNGLSIALNVSSLLIAAIGATWLLVAGHVDLSIGSMYGLISMTVALVARDTGHTWLAIVAGLGCGFVLGVWNGLLVRYLSVNPIIVTLGLLLIYRGLAYAMTQGEAVFDFPESFLLVGRWQAFGVMVPVFVAIIVYALAALWLRSSVAGLRTYAIGGNSEAARRRGVNTEQYTTVLYGFNGVLIGIVAVLTTARLGSGTPSLGTGFELDVITAIILGGVSFAGGAGRASGVLSGIALIGVLNAGLVFVGADDEYQQIVKGAVLLLALAGDQYGYWTIINVIRRFTRADRRHSEAVADHGDANIMSVVEDGVHDGHDGVLERGIFAAPRSTIRTHEDPILACGDISVHFGAVTALAGVATNVYRGEVVCLVGDNGAGKSTLIKVLSGVMKPNRGWIRVDGKDVQLTSPAEARAVGIETVYQDLALFPNLSVSHNMIVGREPRRSFGPLQVRDDIAADVVSAEHMERLGIVLPDHGAMLSNLSGGQRQAVAIAGAATHDLRVLIMDEPTAALGVSQTRNVLSLARSVAESGAGVILISHDVDTVLAVADRVVVLRLGEVVFNGLASELSEAELVHLMAGIALSAATE